MPIYSYAYYTSGSLWQYNRDEPALDNDKSITDFLPDNINCISFNRK